MFTSSTVPVFYTQVNIFRLVLSCDAKVFWYKKAIPVRKAQAMRASCT
jgi:hypothetical protein